MAMEIIEIAMATCESNNQLRRLPNAENRIGNGNLSTKGAQINLNEKANAARLKYVTSDLATPASLNQRDNDENIRSKGKPAAKTM
jgi:hypothetical protein